MGNIYSVTVMRPTRSGRGEVLLRKVVDAGEATIYKVKDWFVQQYDGLVVSVENVVVIAVEIPGKSQDPTSTSLPSPIEAAGNADNVIVETENYLSDVNVPLRDNLKTVFDKAKDAYYVYRAAEDSVRAAVAQYYKDPFVQRVEDIRIKYGYDNVTVGKIVLDRPLFEARIRKETPDGVSKENA